MHLALPSNLGYRSSWLRLALRPDRRHWLATCSAAKSDAELGLNAQQAAGRRLYDQYCDRCHEPYSSRDKKGRSLQGVFKKQFLPQSGMPANDERVAR